MTRPTLDVAGLELESEALRSGAAAVAPEPPSPRSRFRPGSVVEKYIEDLRTFPEDAIRAFRVAGWRGVWDEVVSRTIHRVIRFNVMVVIESTLHPGEAPHEPPPGITVGCTTRIAELKSILTARAYARVRDQMERGAVLLVARRGSVPVGLTLVSFGSDWTPGVRLPLPPDAAYAWGLYVVPAERGRGIGGALAAGARGFLGDAGASRVWAAISLANVASQRALGKLTRPGTHVVGTLFYLKVFRRLIPWFRASRVSIGSAEEIEAYRSAGPMPLRRTP